MKAVVFHDIGDVRVEDVPDPTIEEPFDAVVRLTTSAICGTDLHMIRGTMPGMQEGTVLGHEGVGVVEAVGDNVRNLSEGDRVVIVSTIACGYCSYCRAGYFAQCDTANPNGPQAGTAFFGGPQASGPFDGMQAEYVRVPYANIGCYKLPDDVSDDAAIMLSDIFPTGYFGVDLAGVQRGDTVAVFGCGPVGQFAIGSALAMGAGRVLAVDRVETRLAGARYQGAETVDFSAGDPVEQIRELTGGIGVDRCIDAVGVDAEPATAGPTESGPGGQPQVVEEVTGGQAKGQPSDKGTVFEPGQAPPQALDWAVQAVAKGGTVAIIGVYPETMRTAPLGQAMQKNLTMRMGNCNHRKYVPALLDVVRRGTVDPALVLSREQSVPSAIDAYEHFDRREPGWTKVVLETG